MTSKQIPITNNSCEDGTMNRAQAAISTLVLGHNSEWWDNSLIWSLAVTALAACVVLVSTAGSIFSHKREGEIAQAELDTFKLNTAGKISDAEARVAEANEQAAKANARANELAAKAEQDRLARVKIEQQLAPRRLSPLQIALLALALREKPGEVWVEWPEDPETKAFGEQIAQVFISSGWHVRRIANIMVLFPQPVGISVEPKRTLVAQMLKIIGLQIDERDPPDHSEFTANLTREYPPGAVILTIGLKPLP